MRVYKRKTQICRERRRGKRRQGRKNKRRKKMSLSSKSNREMESATPPPIQPPKESKVKLFKFIWRALLISNLALGGYMFIKKKTMEDASTEKRKQKERKAEKRSKGPADVASTQVASSEATDPETPPLPPPVPVPVKVLEPIPVDQQRELFQWMLEEKRKIKPTNREEKKQIDEDKAILKHFIRAESIPNF